jgi:hypothetical protein
MGVGGRLSLALIGLDEQPIKNAASYCGVGGVDEGGVEPPTHRFSVPQ